MMPLMAPACKRSMGKGSMHQKQAMLGTACHNGLTAVVHRSEAILSSEKACEACKPKACHRLGPSSAAARLACK